MKPSERAGENAATKVWAIIFTAWALVCLAGFIFTFKEHVLVIGGVMSAFAASCWYELLTEKKEER